MRAKERSNWRTAKEWGGGEVKKSRIELKGAEGKEVN